MNYLGETFSSQGIQPEVSYDKTNVPRKRRSRLPFMTSSLNPVTVAHKLEGERRRPRIIQHEGRRVSFLGRFRGFGDSSARLVSCPLTPTTILNRHFTNSETLPPLNSRLYPSLVPHGGSADNLKVSLREGRSSKRAWSLRERE